LGLLASKIRRCLSKQYARFCLAAIFIFTKGSEKGLAIRLDYNRNTIVIVLLWEREDVLKLDFFF
jgi:hypothetical protein